MTAPVPAFADPADAAAFGQYRDAQVQEYGTWVASGDIRVGGALAFTAGHPVPKSTVEEHGWDRAGIVVRAGTPPPEPGTDRAEQLRRRQAELEAERAAIDAELADASTGPVARPAALPVSADDDTSTYADMLPDRETEE